MSVTGNARKDTVRVAWASGSDGCRSGSEPQSGADLPEVGERRSEQRRSQVFDPARAAGPALRADRPLHHLHVSVPPLLHALVEVNEALGDERRIGVAAIDRDRAPPGPAVRDRGLRRDRVAAGGDVDEERVPDRWLVLGCRARRVGRRTDPAAQRRRAGSRIPSAASTWRNPADWNPDAESSRSRNDRNWSGVIVSSTSTCATSVLRIFSTRLSRWSAVSVSPVGRRATDAGELVAELLEPQLVDLVDDDEQELIVLGAVRPGRSLDLERQQFRHLEI